MYVCCTLISWRQQKQRILRTTSLTKDYIYPLCIYNNMAKGNTTIMNWSTHYQLRGIASTLRTAHNHITPAVVAMDSCFILVRTHQHSIASTVSLTIRNVANLKNFNPLSPKSDQHQISPCSIKTFQNRVVTRITDMITQDEFAWYFINFPPLLL